MSERQLPAVIQAVESRLPELKKLLPADVSADTFLSHFKTAAMQTPGLLDCTPRSVVLACVRSANDGLVVDGREAVIIVRNSKQKDGSWQKVAVYQRMYSGTIKRVRAALPGCKVEARLVHDKDIFTVSFGDVPSITHKPVWGPDKGKVVGVYAIVTEANGTQHREVMELEDIERIRDGSQNYNPAQPKGVWVEHFGEMAKKTVLNRLAKLLPQAAGRPALSADADDHNGADDEVEVFDATTVALPPEEGGNGGEEATDPGDAPRRPSAQGTIAKTNGGEITSGKPPYKPSTVPSEPVPAEPVQSDVVMWKTRLRELRAGIAETVSKLVVEEEWEAWEERYKPVPEEVVVAAKNLIDKRLAAMEAQAAEYAKASTGK